MKIWKRLATVVATVILIPVAATASPSLNCAVRRGSQTFPLHWFEYSRVHLSGVDLEPLNVKVFERAVGRYEIQIVDAVEDEVWDKLVELLTASDATPEDREKIRQLGRTRITKAFVGLSDGILHFEHRLGIDANLFEVSCALRAEE